MKDSNSISVAGYTHPDRESWARPGDAIGLRLWLRMLTCSTLVENRVRSLMRTTFDTTLPRFDLMAQLADAPRGMKMSDLSRRMMVTNGNITGIADQLEKDGLIERIKDPADRRSSIIRLTAKGRRHLQRMQRAHESWVQSLMSGVSPMTRQALFELLGDLKQSTLAVLPAA